MQFEVKDEQDNISSCIPLCLVLNCRSICNKSDNLKEIMNQICPDLILASETWERKRMRMSDVLKSNQFKSVSYYRKNKSPGGGCAIIFNDKRFKASELDVCVPDDIEVVWALFTPLAGTKT